MKILICPLNGPRNISEFAYGGEVKRRPAPDASSEAWSAYLYEESANAGRIFEWWFHVPTAFWFIAERDTITDEMIRSMTVAEFEDDCGALAEGSA